MEDVLITKPFQEKVVLKQTLQKQQRNLNRLSHEARAVVIQSDHKKQHAKNTSAMKMQDVLKQKDLGMEHRREQLSYIKHKELSELKKWVDLKDSCSNSALSFLMRPIPIPLSTPPAVQWTCTITCFVIKGNRAGVEMPEDPHDP